MLLLTQNVVMATKRVRVTGLVRLYYSLYTNEVMDSKDCVFCRIVRGELPSKKEYEDEDIIVFHDIHPKAPVHLLIIPKEHIKEFAELQDLEIWMKMAAVAKDIIQKHKLAEKGYRLVNNGAGAALIDHLHLHLMGGIPHTREI